MKLLIAGSHGLVGTNIIPVLAEHFDITALDIEDWDIMDSHRGEQMIREHNPRVLINLAAMTDVDGCEDRGETAGMINSDGPAVLAELCRLHKTRLIHFSTDYVFDGEKDSPYEEEDQPNPMSVYGATKLAGERRVLEILPSSVIVRAQWIYGHGGDNFISKVVRIARQTGAARVVNDQRGSPTYAKDLAWPIKGLIEKNAAGIYHVANSGSCTWFEFAKEVFSLLHMDVPLTPLASSSLDRKARRPRCSVFDCSKILNVTGVAMRPWKAALKEYLSVQ
jgi:dTDP-4-dehydrorhamnose reductase